MRRGWCPCSSVASTTKASPAVATTYAGTPGTDTGAPNVRPVSRSRRLMVRSSPLAT